MQGTFQPLAATTVDVILWSLLDVLGKFRHEVEDDNFYCSAVAGKEKYWCLTEEKHDFSSSAVSPV